MVSVMLPLSMFLLDLGRTIDLRNYGIGPSSEKTIYDGKDILQKELMTLNASYYVLPDEKIPYEKLHAPLDIILGSRGGMRYDSLPYPPYFLDTHDIVMANSFEGASILVVAEYKTFSRSLREDAQPIPNWQEHVDKKHTHYVDETVYGGRLASLITIKAEHRGDVQILRRLVRETFGTSGPITNDTATIWEKFLKSLENNPDLRHSFKIKLENSIGGGHIPTPDTMYNATTLLKYVAEFPKHVDSSPESLNHTTPIFVHLKPLSDLDESYLSLEKNVEAERYMKKLATIEKDVQFTMFHNGGVDNHLLLESNETDLMSFFFNIQEVLETNLSLYKDIDLKAFQNIFDAYNHGLKGNYSSFYEKSLRLHEIENIFCFKFYQKFHKSTRGYLRSGKDQGAVEYDNVDLKECEDECLKVKPCRAIAYTEKGRKCWVYQRSTMTAAIELPEEGTRDDVKIYDRYCG